MDLEWKQDKRFRGVSLQNLCLILQLVRPSPVICLFRKFQFSRLYFLTWF